jgi:hypothetical protein
VRTLLSPERVKLWDACERDSWKPHPGAAYNWPVTLAALKREFAQNDMRVTKAEPSLPSLLN